MLPIFRCKEYSQKHLSFYRDNRLKSQKAIRFKSCPTKFKSFRTAEVKWRNQISQTAGKESEVPTTLPQETNSNEFKEHFMRRFYAESRTYNVTMLQKSAWLHVKLNFRQ